MLNDTQKIVDALDKEIRDAEKALVVCKEGPFHRETAKRVWYLKGLKKAQEIFLGSIDLPF